MPWVRFWHKGNCPSGHDGEESTYEWFDKAEPFSETLKDEAEERVPYWRRDAERGYKYGFEILEVLPEKVRLRLVSEYRAEKRHAERMLEILGPAPRAPGRKKPAKPKTAWDRVAKEDPV